MKNRLLAAAVLLLSVSSPHALAAPPAPAGASSVQARSAAPTVTARVKGMVCDFCAQSVTKVFGKEPGVAAVTVDLDKGEIGLALKPGAQLADARIGELVRKSGYVLVSVSRTAVQ